MNHNLGVQLGQGQFIEIRKVSGAARSGSKFLSVSFFKKYFDGIQAGDYLYFTKLSKEKYMISKTPYSEMSYPKRILAQGKTTLKLFIDESDLLLGSYYSFFKRGERILMKKSTLKEIGMRKRSKRTSKSGLVKANQDAISIQKQDLQFFRGEHGYHVEIHQGTKLYMRITQIPVEDIHQDRLLKNLMNQDKEQDVFEYDAYCLVPKQQLTIPRMFLKKSNMRRGDHFTLKKVNEQTMLIIPKKQKDEIMDDYFDPFEKARKTVTINQEESSEIKSMQRIKDQTKLDLFGMLEEMRKINNNQFI